MKIVLFLYFILQCAGFSSVASAAEELVWVNTGPTKEFIESKKEWAKKDAQRDILQNKMRVVYLSQFGEDDDKIKSAILKKYNIAAESVPCVTSPGQNEYWEVYDSLISEELFHRYGKNFWPKVEAEVKQEKNRASKKAKSSAK